jgi:single-stranded-DNA-specific exonuclease
LLNLENYDDLPFGVCLFAEQWHQGVIGLLAARVKERVHRPTIIFAPGNTADELKGSARSIAGFHIRDALAAVAAQYPELINKFGGHAMAAGLTIKRQDYPQFSQAFDAEVRRHLILDNLRGWVHSDGELAGADFCLDLADCLRAAGPWGQGFPEPVFDGHFKLIQQWVVGGRHLKMVLGVEGGSPQVDAIAFNVDLKSWPNHRMQHVHAAYRLDINEYQGRRSLQLIVEQLDAV